MFVGWRPPAFRRPSPLRVRAVYLKRLEKGGPGGWTHFFGFSFIPVFRMGADLGKSAPRH